ncbi:MAG: sterol-binding protein [Oxalobacteraceae bacterium]|jgi:ubiquinone biosynthesis protein UbiJ|nr:sterol-binding protein [Oxalobacteraceae bacterium]
MLPERSLTAAINHLLSRQPVLRHKLSMHAGKVACIDVGFIQLSLAVASDGLLESANAEPSVTITIKPADLPQILGNIDRAFSYVSISGDADLARTISEVANGLQWEVEEDLAPWVGDIAALRIANAGRQIIGAAKSTAQNLAENMAEYWLEENPTLLYRRAGEDFATDVARLRDDVERLSKRVEQIERLARTDAGAA